MDQKAIEAGINYFEFRFREADFSSFPKGLMYGIDVFDSWLYDENKPFAYLQQLAIYDELKKLAKEGLFRNLIQTYLLDNTHASIVTLIPKTGLAAEMMQRPQKNCRNTKRACQKKRSRKSLLTPKSWQHIRKKRRARKYSRRFRS